MKYLKSRTNVTIVLMFLIGGFGNIVEFMPEELLTVILALLSALAVYFRSNPAQKY